MKRIIRSVPAAMVFLSCLIVFADEKQPQYYYGGNLRKMRFRAAPKKDAYPAQTGKGAVGVPGVVGTESLSGASAGAGGGGRYFTWRDVKGSMPAQTHSAPGGAPVVGGQIELPMQTFTVGAGTVMVPYVPSGDARMRLQRKHGSPYYTVGEWAPPY
ncbi:MAG: hypothetical protein AB1696_24700 [Planctomycetota bacterium]